MVIELRSYNGKEFHLSEAGWQAVIHLARTQGVELPVSPGFAISAEEAWHLADGVERGMARVAARGSSEAPLLRAMFSSRSQAHWQGFVSFCRLGGFRVEQSS